MRKMLGAFAAAATMALAAAAPASADVHWTVSGVFQDGGTLTGWFNINVYGELGAFDLFTQGGGFSDFEYTSADPTDYTKAGSHGGPPFYPYIAPYFVDFQPGYHQDLHLVFDKPLDTQSANNPLIVGNPGPSYECIKSYSCYIPSIDYGGSVRYLSEGTASAPEPAAWALMIGGFGLAGAALRARRKLAAA